MIYSQTKLSPRISWTGLKIITAQALVTSLRNFPRPCVLMIAVYLEGWRFVCSLVCWESTYLAVFVYILMDINTLWNMLTAVHTDQRNQKFPTSIGLLLFLWPLKRLPSSVSSISPAVWMVQCIAVIIVWMNGHSFHNFELSSAHEKFLVWTEL